MKKRDRCTHLYSVENADYIGEKIGRKIYAAAKGTDNISIKLNLEPSGADMALLAWSGSNAGTDNLERIVPASNLITNGLNITATYAGENVFKGKVYVLPGAPATNAAATVTTTLTLSSEVELDPDWFGGFFRVDAWDKATYDYLVYYKNKKWKVVLNGVTCNYRYNIQNVGRTDITNGSIDPFPLGMGMSSNTTQNARRQQAVDDFTPIDNSGWWVPPQSQYCCPSFFDDHERFHYVDLTRSNHT